MREIEIKPTLRIKIPKNGLNVNSIFFGLKEAGSAIMLAITKILFIAIEEQTITDTMNQDTEHRYVRNGRQQQRTLKTSFGDLKYCFAQIKYKQLNQNIVPLRDKLHIPKYQRYQQEAMEPSIGLAVHLSYNRSEKEIERIRGFNASRWTVWRRLHKFSDQVCQFGDLKRIPDFDS